MHTNPSSGGSPERDPIEELERRLLLELVVDPPPEGDRLADLAARLDASLAEVSRAASALAVSGLAVLDDDVARASPAALRFEALWPVCL